MPTSSLILQAVAPIQFVVLKAVVWNDDLFDAPNGLGNAKDAAQGEGWDGQ